MEREILTVRRVTRCLSAVVLTFVLTASSVAQERRIGSIAFFGQEGFDTTEIRNALPFKEGSTVSLVPEQREIWKETVRRAVRQVAGHDPTDVARICCDEKGDLLVYIGLPGKSSRALTYNPSPKGRRQFSMSVVTLARELDRLSLKAVQEGKTREDGSAGYSLAIDYPELRMKQLELRDYALEHEPEIIDVLLSSSDAEKAAD